MPFEAPCSLLPKCRSLHFHISYSSPLFCCHISPAEGFHRVCRCVKSVHDSVPNWGLIFFGSDRFTAFRVKATADVHWDVFVPSFRADCDFYQTLKVSGWSLQHCNAGRVVVAWQARLAEGNAALPHTRTVLPSLPVFTAWFIAKRTVELALCGTIASGSLLGPLGCVTSLLSLVASFRIQSAGKVPYARDFAMHAAFATQHN